MRHPSELRPGDRFHSYRVVREVARGGFGVVYELVHGRSGRRAALKVLTKAGMKPEVMKRFLNEARAANTVRHPGIVDIMDQGNFEDEIPWLLMEFVEGDTLEDRIRSVHTNQAPPFHDPIAILFQLAHVLQALHERGVVHRDLKPANVKLMPDPSRPEGELAKLLDFGIAKFVSDSLLTFSDEGPVQPHTRADVIMGTPPYMAPEQCVSAAAVTGAADVYALGVIAYELLSGRRPFQVDWPAIAHVKLTQDAPSIDTPGLASELVNLIMSMLRRKESERPTMVQVAEELGKLGGRGVSGAQMRSLSVSVRHREESLKRRWLVGGLMAGLMVLGLSVPAFFLISKSSTTNPISVKDGSSVGTAGQPYAAPSPVDLTTGDDAETGESQQQDMSLSGVPKSKGTDLAVLPSDMSSTQRTDQKPTCTPVVPSQKCFIGDGLSGPQKEVFEAAALKSDLRLCREQVLTLEPSSGGFLECISRPASMSQKVCASFILAVDALWHVGWPTPKRVEVKCR